MAKIHYTEITRQRNRFDLETRVLPSIYFGGHSPEYEGMRNTPIDNSARLFINSEKSFKRQLSAAMPYFPGNTEPALAEKMRHSLGKLLSFSPVAISLQLTNEGSIFYTVQKNDLTIFLDHYLMDDPSDKDEAIVSIYEDDQKILDFAGTLDETIREVSTILAQDPIHEFVFA